MKEQIKRIKGLSFASLIVFLSAVTLTAGPVRLAKSMWQLERYALVASLMTAQWPENARVPSLESEFQFQPMMKPSKAPVLDLVKDFGQGEEVFGGIMIPNDEIFNFRRKQRILSDDASLVQERREYEQLHTGKTVIHYEPYELDSLAHPGRTHHVVLADGVVEWTGVQSETKEKWVMIRDGEDSDADWDIEAVNKQLMFFARPWITSSDAPADAFPKALKAYREQVIRLPVLGVEVLSPWVGISIVVLALYLSVSLAHAIYQLRDAKLDDSEPWIAYQSWTPRNRAERLVFRVFAGFGVVTSLVALALPVASVVIVEALVDRWLFFPAFTFIAIVVAIALYEFVRLLRSGRLATKQLPPPPM